MERRAGSGSSSKQGRRLRALASLVLAAPLAVAFACGGQSENAHPESVASEPLSFARAREELNALGQLLDQLASEAEQALPSQDPTLTERVAALRQAQRDVAWLARQLPSWQESPAVDAFVAAISEHHQVLVEARAAPAAKATVDAVARDVSIKAQQCRAFGGPVPVEVRVVTRDGAQREVNGYEVWYVRKAYENRSGQSRRFERNSSPAERVFVEAGYYVLWAEHIATRAQGLRAVRLDVEVGPNQRSLVVDLTVPVTTVDPAADASGKARVEDP
jgi:hypothetical protein